MSITPPGDIRPAFAHDIEFMRSLPEGDFGPGCGKAVLPEGRIVLMNKVPGLDRMEEIIVDGAVIGTARYDIGVGWKIILRVAAARMMQDVAKGMVVADDGAVAPIQKSSSLMVPGVVSAFAGIKKGDEVIWWSSPDTPLPPEPPGCRRRCAQRKGGGGQDPMGGPAGGKCRRGSQQDWDMVIRANSPVMKPGSGTRSSSSGRPWRSSRSPRWSPSPEVRTAWHAVDQGCRTGPAVFFIDTGLEFPETVHTSTMWQNNTIWN